MKPSDIWGATEETHGGLPEPEVTIDGIDCSHMTAEEAFKAGILAGKKTIVKEFDDYFTDPKRGGKLSTPQILECLGCTPKELDALCTDNLDFSPTLIVCRRCTRRSGVTLILQGRTDHEPG